MAMLEQEVVKVQILSAWDMPESHFLNGLLAPF